MFQPAIHLCLIYNTATPMLHPH